MDDYFEIAYAAVNQRLCLLTGTGFSKSISENKVPDWEKLLTDLCDLNVGNAEQLQKIKQNFLQQKPGCPSENKKLNYPLEDVAQMIAIALEENGLNIYEEIIKIVQADEIVLARDGIDEIKKFFNGQSFRVITTNYDKLAQALIDEKQRYQTITPGLTIPRVSTKVKFYHIHGSVDVPDSMVVTTMDYMNFLNQDSYFSRKISTMLYENTVVILGYSLSDTNLKAILHEYQSYCVESQILPSIFFVSRKPVDDALKSHYHQCYGIKVIDSIEMNVFFDEVNKKIERADEVKKMITKMVEEGLTNTCQLEYDDYLRIQDSFYEICSAIKSQAKFSERKIQKLIVGILKHKQGLTEKYGEWQHYVHLAMWLNYLLSIVPLKTFNDDDFQKEIINIIDYSFSTMRKTKVWGYSWQVFDVWKKDCHTILRENKAFLKEKLGERSDDGRFIIAEFGDLD